MININIYSQQLDISKVKTAEHQLDDVMELIDTTFVKSKLIEVEADYKLKPSELNKIRLGIIYHETALNLGFLAKTKFKGYSKKSYDVLTELQLDSNTKAEFLSFTLNAFINPNNFSLSCLLRS